MENGNRIASAAILASVATICFAGRAVADDAATHDLECLASTNILNQSTDPKVRSAAPAVYTFYLGRLTQMGLGPAQIEKDIEDMALSLKQHPNIDQPDFAKACGDAPSAVVAEMNMVQKRDLAAKRREFGPAAPSQR
ncbi:MAG: hypothetical protein V4527_10535 [Pseudomonadota bacterium]